MGGDPAHIAILIKQRFVPILAKLFIEDAFDIKREVIGYSMIVPMIFRLNLRQVAHALVNIASEQRNVVALAGIPGVLPQFLNLLRAPDPDVIRLSLDFLGLLLHHCPTVTLSLSP